MTDELPARKITDRENGLLIFSLANRNDFTNETMIEQMYC